MHHCGLFFALFHMLGLEDQFEWKTIAITAIEICRLTREGERERSSRSLVLLININEQQ